MEYELISNESIDKLNKLVNDKLNNGWTLYGDHQLSITTKSGNDTSSMRLKSVLNNYIVIFSQAVTKNK